MNAVRPARCLICTYTRATVSRLPRRRFHCTPIRAEQNSNGDGNGGSGRQLSNVGKINDSLQRSHEGAAKEEGKAQERKEEDEEVVKPGTWREMKTTHFKPYTAEEKAKLQSEYSPEQLVAIEAGESAIKPEELAEQFLPREDPWAFQYLDDFSTIEPVVDHHIRAPLSNYDPNSRLKDEEDFVEDIAKYVENMSEDPSPVDFLKFTDNLRLTTGKEEAERNPHSALVPDIMEPGETLETVGRFKPEIQELAYEVPETSGNDVTPELRQLMLTTGYDEEFIRGLRIKSLVYNSVANQTRLGKVRKMLILSIAGNGKGLLGLGEGKGEEMAEAQTQSQYRAIRNMQPILRYENRTIFGDLKAKVGGTPVVLMHKPPGFGLRCQHHIYEMCRAVGIYDLAARVGGARNPANAIKATYEALLSQRDPEDIARARGRKMVDVRKVYYAGKV